VGTTNGLNKYNPTHDNFTRIISDSISFIYDIKEDSYQNLWLAMYNNNGAAKLNMRTNKWTYYQNTLKENDPMVNSKLTGIHIDNQKRLWFSSEGSGIFITMKKTGFNRFQKKTVSPTMSYMVSSTISSGTSGSAATKDLLHFLLSISVR
jgi:ligand-binding sensor domain-containing protein